MYVVSSLTFGIILLVRASLAQPYIYQDSSEDEEALIDRLASLAAVVGSQQQFQKQVYSNYDIPQMGGGRGYVGDMDDDLLTKEYIAKLPRQFGYKPDDARFYLPAEQFPNLSRDETHKAELSKFRTPKQNMEPQEVLQQSHEIEKEEHHSEHTDESLKQHFMKKNEIKETERAQHAQNIVASPSHFMSSDHSVDKSSFPSLHPVENDSFSYSDIYYIGLIAGCSAAVAIGLVAAGIFWYRIHQRVKAAAEVDYPAYGVTGPISKDVSPSGGDRKLAQSAQMYHYQHQKQQMAALQKGGALQEDRQGSAGSEGESEDDNDDDNDYTVYECPGLAPAGEMEVKNPLFQDEATPATPNIKSEDDK